MSYSLPISEDTLNRTSLMAASACLACDVHPVSVLQRIFTDIDLLFALDSGEIDDRNYMSAVFDMPYSDNDDSDPSLKGMLWALSVDLFYLSANYGYDLFDINNIMIEHRGWEYLACSGRHMCYDEPAVASSIINNFLKTH